MKNLPQSRKALVALVMELKQEISQLKAENQQLKLQLLKKKSKPPFHPKANVVRDQEGQEEAADTSKKQRKLRVKAYTRKRSTPTHRVVHASSHCEACGESVSGQSVAWTREIIDLPVIKPTVTEHM
ncbi:hypothetical protein KKA49_01475, partial [Patescibacteria group bacterium]|nr:hypothetical protein [Patescibacteria group bacterium]